MPSNSKLILVTGDAICDNNYYKGVRETADSRKSPGFQPRPTDGGALLLEKLIATATADLSGWRTQFDLDSDQETLPQAYHAFCLWEPQPADPQEKDPDKQYKVWRAVEPPLGYGQDSENPKKIGRRRTPVDPPEILVIDDAGLGFRDPKQEGNWPLNAEWEG